MNFRYTEEQKLLRDSLKKIISQHHTFDDRRLLLGSELGWDAANWKRFAELGLLALPFAERDGGLGGGAIETMLVMERFGEGLVLEPYLSYIVLGGGIIHQAADDHLRQALIPAIADGSERVALAHEEHGARYDLAHVDTVAARGPEGFRLTGRKTNVLFGDGAKTFIVSARTAGHRCDAHGISLFRLPSTTSGLVIQPHANFDGTRSAVLDLDGAQLGAEHLIGPVHEAYDAIETVYDHAVSAVCAEAVGAMDALLWATVEYLKTRQQFGGPLSRMQVLRHRAADMYVALEQARSMAILAASTTGHEDRMQRRWAISAAKVQICKSARFIGQQAVQLHGGIGMTDEYVVGHYFRRLSMIERLFGDADHHLNALQSLSNAGEMAVA